MRRGTATRWSAGATRPPAGFPRIRPRSRGPLPALRRRMTGTALAPLPATVASELPTSAALANPPRREHAEPARRIRRATLAPGDRVGAWRIDAEIGRGGMGSVYAVTHQGFGKR